MSYGGTDVRPGASKASEAENLPGISQRSPTSAYDEDSASGIPTRWQKTKHSLHNFYDRNFGLFLVFLAQTCGSIMNVAAKVLANDPSIRFHALQIIFIRMLCTTVIGSAYMWYHSIRDFPLGQSRVRGLLILRGTAGFIGLFGLYYSLSWLEFADATVITFIIPTVTALVCFVWLREPYTIKEAAAGMIAFIGVLFVAHPPWLFPEIPVDPITGKPINGAAAQMQMLSFFPGSVNTLTTAPLSSVSPQQRTLAILIAIMGACGAATAYATIRVIGKRAHSLISVNYFAAIATLGSSIIVLVHPSLHFVLPKTWWHWGLVTVIGITGFLLQFLLTEGLQREKGGRATNLTYLQLVFALIVERLIWGTTPPVESLVGATLIIGAAIWVSLQKNGAAIDKKKEAVADEERSLLGRREDDEE